MKLCEASLISFAMVLLFSSQVRTECTPGAIWKEDCNTCFCNQDRQVSCTRMACASRNKRDISLECSPGTTWKEDCNTCFCSSNGLKACTLMACPPPKREIGECIPGTIWKEDCNTCVCHAGGTVSCTDMGCSRIPLR